METSPSRQIDHLVIAVPDLARAARQYASLGFTLTPVGHHDWGTMNQLVQFESASFIELLAVEDATRLSEHAVDASPPRFSFGAHNRDYLRGGQGMSMLVLSGQDSRADVAAFAARGLDTYAPFDFERRATLPDGEQVAVSFSLAFVTHPRAPRMAVFTCHNRFPQYFWRPAFQAHANGAAALSEVVVSAPAPEPIAQWLAVVCGGPVTVCAGGHLVGCGPHRLRVLTPVAIAARFANAGVAPSDEIRLVGYTIVAPGCVPHLTPAQAAGGAFIQWLAAARDG